MADNRAMISKFQTALRVVYPPRCVGCGQMVDSDFGLCGTCWSNTPFIGGLVCDACGTQLPGSGDGHRELCDDCMQNPRSWKRGRAALVYADSARKLILALKHGDRQDIAAPAAKWMANSIRPLLEKNTIIAPVPLHWRRMVKRRFNQSALLGGALSKEVGLSFCPDLLVRTKHTQSSEGKCRAERISALIGAIQAHPKRLHRMAGRSVLLVDDVMTTGATLEACTQACLAGHATEVIIITLARVAKDA
ncbi:ComF family protein [Shimia abyssi]|nr:ComF family protein [Shimia abyssi]